MTYQNIAKAIIDRYDVGALEKALRNAGADLVIELYGRYPRALRQVLLNTLTENGELEQFVARHARDTVESMDREELCHFLIDVDMYEDDENAMIGVPTDQLRSDAMDEVAEMDREDIYNWLVNDTE